MAIPRSWGWMCGSTPTISSTRTSVLTISQPSIRWWIGPKWPAAIRQREADLVAGNGFAVQPPQPAQ
ncbi:unknown [Bacillus thuringiensis phage MZTP02]|uniref:Uncharacterized protein n=1 Tax=Bacillus thuringiensis phage MZTP02 TaxID=311221 RepID=Q56AR8_9CAUD|nr:unknown [Bacillus thuringiensis phage MZTP02]